MSNADDELLEAVRRCARSLEAGRITVEEFLARLFDECAYDHRDPVHFGSQLLAIIPEHARAALRERITATLQPEFRKPAWHIGGPPRTEKEREFESLVLTARVRAWAVALERQLNGANSA
jgi:hypothetical protein